jgi:hypothetical protein
VTILARQWVPAAAVVPQECGPEFLGIVDGADWSEGRGFYRGFFTTFTIKAGKTVWFHWPLPTPVEIDGRQLALASVSLLWETLEGAAIRWITVQHGGMDRIELTARMQSPAAEPVPFEPSPEFRPYCPETNRQLSTLPLPTPLPLRFGVQLCVMVSAPDDADAAVRFYGAGADFVACAVTAARRT